MSCRSVVVTSIAGARGGRLTEPATVRQTARLLGLSVRTVQADVRAGCGGIVRPGGPGRGNGALIDVPAYRNWRAQRVGGGFDLDVERDRGFSLLCEVALRIYQESGGVTRNGQAKTAELLLRLLTRFAPAYLQRDLDDVDELPEEMRTMLRVFAELKSR